MILIDFQTRQIIIGSTEPIKTTCIDTSFLEMTYFLTPIRVNINGVELFSESPQSLEKDQSFWLEMPLIGFSLMGEKIIREVCTGGTARFWLPDVGAFLDFKKMPNEMVEIFSSINKLTTDVNCQELLDGFLEFIKRVKQKLKQDAPDIVYHEVLGKWVMNNS